jgi:nitroimidazol reductase NimA-like FMN-containing flavoprotein (pyridoxamine 5'-phosphate oxidase superfamily)
MDESVAPPTTAPVVPRQDNPTARTARVRDRTAVRRLPDKQVRDRSTLDAILDAALVAHVAVVDDGVPYVVPMGCARDHDEMLVHGSTASRACRTLAAGTPTCATVTLLDGIVVARSRFESSMHYRSAMMTGTFEVLHGQAKVRALDVLTRRLLPGLDGAREPSERELAATAVLALPLDQWSVKVSAGFPEDAAEDLGRRSWAGVVPMLHTWGAPLPAPDLADGISVPDAIARWPRGRG